MNFFMSNVFLDVFFNVITNTEHRDGGNTRVLLDTTNNKCITKKEHCCSK
jgi:hypothetical protein